MLSTCAITYTARYCAPIERYTVDRPEEDIHAKLMEVILGHPDVLFPHDCDFNGEVAYKCRDAGHLCRAWWADLRGCGTSCQLNLGGFMGTG